MSRESFVPYLIDHQVVSKGKTLGASKKRIIFKFGFANQEALANGMVGANCRGTEHEVVLIWSLNSGKRQILADGKEVHYSESGVNGWTADKTFQHSFTLRSPGYGAFRCRLTTIPSQPGLPPFDLNVGGVSIHQMSKIYQLGATSNGPRAVTYAPSSSSGGDIDVDPYATPEERRLIAQAKLESLRDLRGTTPHASGYPAVAPSAPPIREEASLISFEEDPTPPAVGGVPSDRGVSAITMDPALTQNSPPAAGPYGTTAPPAAGPYGTAAPPPAGASSALTPWQPPAAAPSGGTAVTYGSGAPTFAQPAVQQQQQPWNTTPSVATAPTANPSTAWGTAAPAPFYPGAAPPPAHGAAPQYAPAPPAYTAPTPPVASTMDPYAAAPPFTSPTAASVGSFGSAPSFAQPPPQPQQQPPAFTPAPAPTYPQYTGY